MCPEVGLAPHGLTHLLADRTSGVLGGPPGGWVVLVNSRTLTDGGLGDQACWPDRWMLGLWQGNTYHMLCAHRHGSHSGTPQGSHLGDEVADKRGCHLLLSPRWHPAHSRKPPLGPPRTRASRAGPPMVLPGVVTLTGPTWEDTHGVPAHLGTWCCSNCRSTWV